MNAVHGAWCNTRTFPINCNYCGDSVFYFSCDCGSRVLFDHLGKPWPVHRCAESGYGPGWLQMDYSSQIIPIDSFHETINREYREKLQQATENDKRSRKKKSWIVRQAPSFFNQKTTEKGVITELIWNTDIFKKAGFAEDSKFGAAMLGKHARLKLAQMTIHTGAIAEDDKNNFSFTFFVEESIVKEQGLTKGNFATAKLRGVVTSPKHPIWVCDKLTGLFDG